MIQDRDTPDNRKQTTWNKRLGKNEVIYRPKNTIKLRQ